MDALDRMADPARDLLHRVDATLVMFGAPADPELWALLTRLAGLPGDAFEFVAALRVDPLAEVSAALRTIAGEYGRERVALSVALEGATWEGGGADAFAAQWRALAAHLGSASDLDTGEETMVGRLSTLASYVDDLVDWMLDARASLAMTMATVLSSAEAVRLRTAPRRDGGPFDPEVFGREGGPESARAAAAVGRRVMATVYDSVCSGQDRYDRWAPRLGAQAYRAGSGPEVFVPGQTRVGR